MPDDLAVDHIVADLASQSFGHVIIQMLLAVEPNHATVVVAAPVLRVDTNQHPSRSRRICPALWIVVRLLDLAS